MAEDLTPVPVDEDAAISVNLGRLATAAEVLAARQGPVETRSKVLTYAAAAILVVALGATWVGVQNRGLAQTAGEQARTNATLTAQIKDCLDPSGQCYRDSRARSGDVERRVLADQAEKAATQLEVVCDLFDTHRVPRPEQCGPDRLPE